MYSFLRGGPAFGASQVSITKVKIASSVSPSGRPAFGVMSIPASLYRCSEAESSRSFFGGCGSSARPRGAPATAAAARAGAESGGGFTSSAVADSSEDWPSAFSLNIRRLARSRAARRALSRKERAEPSCFELSVLSVLRRAVELRRCVKTNRADGSERRVSASRITLRRRPRRLRPEGAQTAKHAALRSEVAEGDVMPRLRCKQPNGQTLDV